MERKKLVKVLELHKKWWNDEEGGERAERYHEIGANNGYSDTECEEYKRIIDMLAAHHEARTEEARK